MADRRTFRILISSRHLKQITLTTQQIFTAKSLIMILCVKSFPLPFYLAAVYLMYLVGENDYFYRRVRFL